MYSDGQPAIVAPERNAITAATTSSPQTTTPASPSQVATRSGAAEKLVTLSAASPTMRDSGYLVRPAARSSRSKRTSPLGKPSHGTTSRRTGAFSGSSRSASTAARLSRRKSPAWAGTCLPTSRRIIR